MPDPPDRRQHIQDALSEADGGPSPRPVVQARGLINSFVPSAEAGGRLHFTGAPGQSYLVEGSTNLTDWETLGPATETEAGSFEFGDAAGLPIRFYRVTAP